MKTSIDMCR